MTVELNPGQQRKIRIIVQTFGSNWPEIYPAMAIDAVYNLAIKDERKSLFCKIEPMKKDKLAEMLENYGTTMGDFIGVMIDDYYERFLQHQHERVRGIANDYSDR
jgi:hypothetical protein